MNGRDAEIVLTTLLGVSAETLRSWLTGEVVPPTHVWVSATIIDTATAASDSAFDARQTQPRAWNLRCGAG